MNTLQIEIPKGFKIDKFDQETGKVTFAELPKDIKERIKTFDDVIRELGDSPQEFRDAISIMDEVDEIAYVKLKLIAKVLNEGWEPNWNDSSETKYYPWFDMEGSSSGFSYYDYDCVYSDSYVGSRLCFKSRDLAEYAGRQFLDIYKDFLTLNK